MQGFSCVVRASVSVFEMIMGHEPERVARSEGEVGRSERGHYVRIKRNRYLPDGWRPYAAPDTCPLPLSNPKPQAPSPLAQPAVTTPR